ncbi:MAG: 50S ribosomal protein L22 [Bacteroidia bacterium]|nr:50S ribosomal protein L22 [Bacteroidia bacterium]
MGVKSRTRAEKREESRKDVASARLNNVPTSPRKMRLVADLIRGKRVELALHILKTNPKHPAIRLHKLVLSAIANWQTKNEGLRIEESDLFVKEIQVDSGRMLKRIQPAPQGRAHRIRKRSNHVTIIIDSLNKPDPGMDEELEKVDEVEEVEEVEVEVKAPKEKKAPKAATTPKASTPKVKTPKAAVKLNTAPKAKAVSRPKKGTNLKSNNKKG